MGRRSAKNMEKKLQRKEEKAKMAVAYSLVRKANDQVNPLASFLPFQKYDRNGICVHLECKRRIDVDEDTLNWAFILTKKNMQHLYEESEWGWNDKNKKEEMQEDAAWYLIARTKDHKPVAFSHFRFDMDYGDEVVYCYELQLEEDYQRKGLGKFLLQVLELMAFRAEMKKVILTVFKHNPIARKFFTAMKYTVDETSPEDSLFEQFDYEIISKLNKKKTAVNGDV